MNHDAFISIVMSLSNIATSLLEASRETSAPKDILADLFPFIYTASKRMSGREISEFLEKEHGVSISQPTLARALKNPQKYADDFAIRIFPAASYVKFSYDLKGVADALNCFEGFLDFLLEEREPQSPGFRSEAEDAYHVSSARTAVLELKQTWFPVHPEFRKMAMPKISELVAEEQLEADARMNGGKKK